MSRMWYQLCALNKLKDVDVAFFIVCAVIIVLIIAVYFLIPVFNKKFYQEQRDNLHKREAAFKSNLQDTRPVGSGEEKPTEEADAKKPEGSKDE